MSFARLLDGRVERPAMTKWGSHATSSTATCHAALDRLLDADNTSVTLSTMGRAAAALGKELFLSLKDAA